MTWQAFLDLLAAERPANGNAEPLRITERNRRDATALRIWLHCTFHDWDCTIHDVADALNLSPDVVRDHCAKRGWTKRMWTGPEDAPGYVRHRGEADEPAHPMAALFDAA